MTTKYLSPNQIAWLLPISIFIHQIEEYFGEFPIWYSNLLNVQLSNPDFLIINGIGLFIFTAFALSYFFNKNNLILVAMGTLVFVNGIIHLALSVFTFTYSPGTISGVVLLIPLGIVIYKRVLPLLPKGDQIIAIVIGILFLFIVTSIAMNI